MTEAEIAWTQNCDTCGRWLVTVYKDGNFDLAGKAGVSMRLLSFDTKTGEVRVMTRPVPEQGTAKDSSWACRLRRWWRTHELPGW
jgi:hypothetical protein